MIGRMKNGRFVPLAYNEDTGAWSPLARSSRESIDAGRACVAHLQRAWSEIERQTRTLRALTEHPSFDFSGDGIDSDMVRNAAIALSRIVHAENENVSRLLDEPTSDDEIAIAGLAYQVSKHSAELKLHPMADMSPAPDDLALQRIVAALLTEVDVTNRGIMLAMDRLAQELEPTDLAETIGMLAYRLDDIALRITRMLLTDREPANGNGVVMETIEDQSTPHIERPSESDAEGTSDEDEDEDTGNGHDDGNGGTA